MRFDTVKRWILAHKCKDTSKVQYLTSFGLFLRAIGVDNPDTLIDEYVHDTRSDDPRIRLRSQDRMNEFYENYKAGHGDYQAWLSFLTARLFYNANGCFIAAKAPFPRVPKREMSERTLPNVKKLTPTMSRLATPVLRGLILTLAESGMRIGTALQLRYHDIKEDYEANRTPMSILLSGRITKTGLPYRAFVLDDAREAIRDELEMRRQQDEPINDETFLFPFNRMQAINRIRQLADLTGLNEKKSGLREFGSKLWRKRVQTVLERDEYHINPNHVSLLLQAKPRGRDAHYSMPPRDELAREYMKAANDLRVSGPLFVKPTTDELLKRIQELTPEERLRLISELEKRKTELGHMATVEQVADVLSKYGLVEQKPIARSGR